MKIQVTIQELKEKKVWDEYVVNNNIEEYDGEFDDDMGVLLTVDEAKWYGFLPTEFSDTKEPD